MKASDDTPEPKKSFSGHVFFKPSIANEWVDFGPIAFKGPLPLPKIFPPFDFQCGMHVPKSKTEHYRTVGELLKRPPSE